MITLQSQVRIADGILFHDLAGEAVLLNLKSGVYLGLDPVGTRIWQLLREPISLETLRDQLLEEYDVPRTQCTEDLLALLEEMHEQQLLEIRA